MTGFLALYVVMLAAFTAWEVVGRAPVVTYAPLVAVAAFLQGIVLVGALLALGRADTTPERVAGFLLVALAAATAVGGYVVAGRSLDPLKAGGSRAE